MTPTSLPSVREACRIAVAIPANNEAASIERTLRAFAHQRMLDGGAFDPDAFEVIVLCNGCIDDTAARARAFGNRAPSLALRIVEVEFARESAHVGTARRTALDLAAKRLERRGRARAVLATTDADSVVAPTWLAQIEREIAGVDAVAGFVTVDASDHERMHAPLRLAYDREVAYRRLIGDVEARYDPRPFDAAPRHDGFVGANFAVTLDAYRVVGGLPALARLEDQAFARALERIDARVRHSFDVRVSTSARRDARVEGGFGSLIAALAENPTGGAASVRSARAILEESRARGLLRTIAARDGMNAASLESVACLLDIDAADLVATFAASPTFGSAWHTIAARCRQSRYAEEPVDVAIAALRADLASANAPFPTRARTASGAG